jgi:hypothetical protein
MTIGVAALTAVTTRYWLAMPALWPPFPAWFRNLLFWIFRPQGQEAVADIELGLFVVMSLCVAIFIVLLAKAATRLLAKRLNKSLS